MASSWGKTRTYKYTDLFFRKCCLPPLFALVTDEKETVSQRRRAAAPEARHTPRVRHRAGWSWGGAPPRPPSVEDTTAVALSPGHLEGYVPRGHPREHGCF